MTPAEINQDRELSQRRIIATRPWHLSNNKALEMLGFCQPLQRSITLCPGPSGSLKSKIPGPDGPGIL
jgi:hypothetical protein